MSRAYDDKEGGARPRRNPCSSLYLTEFNVSRFDQPVPPAKPNMNKSRPSTLLEIH